MSIKITVNGVDYSSVEAMPPDVRKVYEEMRARFPNLAIGEEAAPATIVSKHIGPLHLSASVQRNIVVNQRRCDSEAEMPPDVRETWEQAMRGVKSGMPGATKDQVKVTFKLDGPTFGRAAKAGETPVIPTPFDGPPSSSAPIPALLASRPIEPGSTLSWRFAYGAAVGVAIVLAWWWLFYR